MGLDGGLGIHAQALLLKSRRAEVLAANIANADTPGFKARDFDFRQALFNEMDGAVRVRTTHKQHLKPGDRMIPTGVMKYRTPMQPSLDGNTVDTQLEYSAFSSNALEYQVSLQFLNGKIKSLQTALKGQ